MLIYLERGEMQSDTSESNEVGDSAKGLCFHEWFHKQNLHVSVSFSPISPISSSAPALDLKLIQSYLL